MSRRRAPWQLKWVTLVLVWGSSFLLMMVALRGFTPWQIVTARILLAALTLAGLLAVTRGRLPREGRVWGHLAVCGFFLGTLPFSCFVWAETRIPSALAGMGNATTAVSTVIAMAVLLSVPVTLRKALGIVVGFVGVTLIAHPWDLVGRPDPLGVTAAVIGGAAYGVGWSYNRRFLAGADLGGLSQPTALMLTAVPQIVPVGLIAWAANRAAQPWPWSPALGVSGADLVRAALALAALGVVNTGLAYMWNFDVVREAGPLVSASMTYLIPAVAVALGVVVLGERLAPIQVAGSVLVLGAAYLVNRPTAAPSAAAGSPTQRSR